MICYFDGSEDDASQSGRKWIFFAGIGATKACWDEFEAEWNKVLHAQQPPITYIHMREVIGLKGPFANLSRSDADRIAFDCIQKTFGVFLNHKAESFHAQVDKTTLDELRASGRAVPNPYQVFAQLGMSSILGEHWERHGIEPVKLLYDRGEPYIHPVKKRWEREKKQRGRRGNLPWSLISSIEPATSATPGIQAADILAWSLNRRNQARTDDEWQYLANMLVATRTNQGLLNTTGILLDDSELRRRFGP